jgi:phenylalanyl-tRNA synthetase beta chain
MDIKIPHSLLTKFLKTSAKPEQIAEALSLCGPTVDQLEKLDHDYLYHIEIITNRVDAASAFGVAREASAILPEHEHETTLINNPYEQTLDTLPPLPKNPPVDVTITDHQLVPRFACIAISGVDIKPSPKDTQNWLELSDQRPLNNLIDITNELTLKYGQPVHIFDLDEIKKHKMIVRVSKPGEKIITLDNRAHTLKGDDIVIEDGEGRLIDLCGIMGGALSSVSDQTTNVLLFVQTYDPKRIRKTSLYVQERTLASQLFEKRPDQELVLPVLIEGAKLILERAGGEISSDIIDLYPNPIKSPTINLNLSWLEQFSGVALKKQQVVNILDRLGFGVEATSSDTLVCTVPTWRVHDVSIKEDLAEEIMRVYGYFRLPSVLPPTTIPKTQEDPLLSWEQQVRFYLAHLGFTEIYNYALISKDLTTKAGLKFDEAFHLSNPLSADYEYMRQSLIPSLLANLESNRGTSQPPFMIFELANVYDKQAGTPLASERSTLTLTTYGLDFAHTNGYLEALGEYLHLPLKVIPTNNPPTPFATKRSGAITLDQDTVGYIGYLDDKIKSNFHLTEPVVIIDLNFQKLSELATHHHHFKPVLPSTPIIEDLTFTLPEKTTLGPIIEFIPTISPTITSVSLKDQYQQNYTFTITYQDANKQLTDKDVAPIREKVVDTLQKKYHAKLVGELK